MSRVHINRISENNILISIGFYKDKISKSLFIFFIFGLLGLVFSIRQIIIGDRFFINVFLIVWSCVWLFFLIKVLNLIKWRRFYREIIEIKKDVLILIEKNPLKTKEYIFKVSDIFLSINDNSKFEYKTIFSNHPGIFNIENQNHLVLKSFGKHLTKDEIAIINQELQLLHILFKTESKTIENTPVIEKDKSSKKYINKLQKRFFLICLLPALLYSYSHFKNQNESSNKLFYGLKSNGIITEVKSEFQKHWDTDYFYYYFIAQNGKKVEKSGKCGNIETFNKDYKYLKVIYNPKTPSEFMEYPDFQRYSTNYSFFWIIISTLFYALFASVIVLFGYLIINGQFRLLVDKK